MDRTKILSIDFDFFQAATRKQLLSYPDGIDLNTKISEIVWSSHYIAGRSNPEYSPVSVNINQKLFTDMIDILQKQRDDIPAMAAQSHAAIYNFIYSVYEYFGNNNLTIFHIDMHHDIWNGNEKLDCGNWVKFIKRDFPNTDVHWITRKVSMEMYNIEDEIIRQTGIMFDFDKIKDIEFDAVFLCRSDMWLPPHLDYYFDTMLNTCIDVFPDIEVSDDVLLPRNIEKIIDQEEQIRKEMEKR